MRLRLKYAQWGDLGGFGSGRRGLSSHKVSANGMSLAQSLRESQSSMIDTLSPSYFFLSTLVPLTLGTHIDTSDLHAHSRASHAIATPCPAPARHKQDPAFLRSRRSSLAGHSAKAPNILRVWDVIEEATSSMRPIGAHLRPPSRPSLGV